MSEQAFVQAIAGDPDNDAPRLIFADWLDDCGQSPRAELIRVQCALTRFKTWHEAKEREHGGRWWQEEWPDADPAALAERLQTLFADEELARRYFLQPLNGNPVYSSSVLVPGSSIPWCWQQRTRSRLWHIRRGFVEKVQCDAVDWLRHADSFVRQHPTLRDVHLTSWPEIIRGGDGYFALGSPESLQPMLACTPAGRFDDATDDRDIVAALLSATWPGIRYRLPRGAPPVSGEV